MPRIEREDVQIASPLAGVPSNAGTRRALERAGQQIQGSLEKLFQEQAEQRRQDATTSVTLDGLQRFETLRNEITNDESIPPSERAVTFTERADELLRDLTQGIPDPVVRARVTRSLGYRVAEQKAAVTRRALEDERDLSMALEEDHLLRLRQSSVLGETPELRAQAMGEALSIIRSSRYRDPADRVERETKFRVDVQEAEAAALVREDPEAFLDLVDDPDAVLERYGLIEPERFQRSFVTPALEELDRRERRAARDSERAVRAREKEIGKLLIGRIVTALEAGQDPGIGPTELAILAPSMRAADILTVRSLLEEAREPLDDPATQEMLEEKINAPGISPDERDAVDDAISLALAAGNLRPATAQRYRDRNEAMRGNDEISTAQRVAKDRLESLVAPELGFEELTPGAAAKVRQRHDQAQARLRAFLLDNPQATETEIQTAVNRIAVDALRDVGDSLRQSAALPYGQARRPTNQKEFFDVIAAAGDALVSDYDSGRISEREATAAMMNLNLWREIFRVEQVSGGIEGLRREMTEARRP